jgi:hypothetical protein
VGGEHYQAKALACPECGHKIQHWDIAWGLNWNCFMYALTKYLWRDKNGLEDLYKARHCLDKYIEVAEKANRSGQ